MANVDQRIVEMKFNNSAFQSGVAATISALDKLKGALGKADGVKGLENMGSGIDTLASKFTNLQVIGVAALGTLVSKATSAGLALTNSLTLGPISEGFNDYNAKLTSVQTIMSATGKSIQEVDGYFRQLDEYADKTVFNLSDMTGAFAKFTNAGVDLDVSVPAIKGIANMTALAGQGADSASIAFYNLSQSIAGGFLTTTDYKSLNLANVATKEWKDQMIAGAVAAGTLKDAGNGIYNIPGSEKAYNDANLFTEALSEGWASAEVLTNVLGDYGDATTEIGKKAQAAAQNVKSLPMMMETLRAAVGTQWTDTFELLLGNVTESTELFTGLTETIGGFLTASGDARNEMLADWKALGGRDAVINSIKNAFTGLLGILRPIGDAFRSVFPAMTGERLAELSRGLEAFTAKMRVGGETAKNLQSTFSGIFSIFKIALSIIGGVTKALFGMFMTVGEGSGGVLAITGLIGDFITKIQQFLTYTGLIEKFFAVLVAPVYLLKPLVGLISDIVVALAALLSGDISGFTTQFKAAFASLGDSFGEAKDKIVGVVGSFGEALDLMAKYFDKLGRDASAGGNKVVAAISSIFEAVVTFLSNFVTDARGTITDLIQTLTDATSEGKNFLAGFGAGALSGILTLVDSLSESFGNFKETLNLGDNLSALNGEVAKAGIGFDVLAGIGTVLTSIWGGLSGLFSGMASAVGPLLSELSAFFQTIVAKLRGYIETLDMGDAVALLNTGFFIAMYLAIARFMNSLKGLIGDLSGIIDSITGVFDQLTNTLKSMQQNVRANIILKIAIAVGILVAAVYVLSEIDEDKLKKALLGLAAIFVQLTAALIVITKFGLTDTGKIAAAGTALVLIAIAVKILASALADMGELSWEEMAKGLTGVGAILVALTLFTKFAEVEKGGVKAGAGLVLLAVAIALLAKSVAVLGAMDTGQLVKGIIALGIMVKMMSQVTQAMNGTKGVVPAAIAMVILAGALLLLSVAVRAFASIDIMTFITGALMMAATLKIVTSAMNAMPDPKTALAGAAAIAIVAGSMLVLSGVLKIFGAMSIEEIAKSLIVLALSLTAIVVAVNAMTGGVAGAAAMLIVAGALAILTPVLVTLGALSWESILKGIAGLALVLGVIVVAMYALTPVIFVLTLFAAGIQALGIAMLFAGTGMALFAGAIGLLAVVGGAGFAVLIAGAMGFLNLLPLMAQQFGYAVVSFAIVIGEAAPRIVEAFVRVVVAMLDGIQTVVPKIIETAGVIIMAFIAKVTEMLPQIFALGLDMILGFLTAIRDRIFEITQTAIEIVLLFLAAIESRLGIVIQKGVDMIMSFIQGLTDAINNNKEELGVKARALGVAIIDGLIATLVPGAVVRKIAELASALINKAKEMLGINSPSRVFSGFGQDIVMGMVNGIGEFLSKAGAKAAEMAKSAITAAKNALSDAVSIGKAIVDGMIRGISNGLSAVGNAAKNLAKSALDSAMGILGINSPSKEFQKIGEFVNDGFVKGLVGKGQDDVKKTFEYLTDTLKSTMEKSAAEVEKLNEQYLRLTESRDKDTEAIKRAQEELKVAKTDKEKEALTLKIRDLTASREKDIKAINETKVAHTTATEELKKSSDAHKALTEDMGFHQTRLGQLAVKYEEVSEKLEAANKQLEDAIKVRDDFERTTTDSFDDMPSIGEDTTVDSYIAGMLDATEKTTLFADSLGQLRELGLNDALYEELLSKGTDALPFVQQLLAGGVDSVNQINETNEGLQKAAKTLGEQASKALYQAGVDTAQGLVDGLKSQESTVLAQMDHLAEAMLTRLKEKLGIASPSKEFAKLGKFSNEGLAKGLKDYTGLVSDASAGVGEEALRSLRATMLGLSDAVSSEVDMNPTIRPVLDLSDVKKQANKIQRLMGANLKVDVSGAQDASAGYLKNKLAKVSSEVAATSATRAVTFVQNNTSPKALSPAEIYRQTNNQISVAKAALTNA